MPLDRKSILGTVALAALIAAPAHAGIITGWNGDNVVTDAGPYVNEVPYYSAVYDRDVTGGTAGATTYGGIAFELPEAGAPGLKVVNDDIVDGSNCIMASSSATCSDGFQSGKRYKQQATDVGPIDLVFDVAAGDESIYRVYQKITNLTGGDLSGFSVELGFNVGDAFVASTAGDGLGFDLTQSFGGSGNPVTTQFPFGLFGDAATNPNFSLDGFFDDERTGFSVDAFEDMFMTTGYYGNYQNLFGDWMTQQVVPMGVFWDNDGDDATEALLMAYFDEASGQWIALREEDGASANPIPATVLTQAEIDALVAGGYELGEIEDLSNVNINYFLQIGDIANWMTFDSAYGTAQFTLRLTTKAAAQVSEPWTLALLAAGGAYMGWRRRRAA